MTEFFEAYYSDANLGAVFLDLRHEAKFKTLAEQFEIISARTRDVYVPYGGGKALIEKLFRVGQLTVDLRRQLQRYTVGLPP